MKLRAFRAFKSKMIKPCSKLFSMFKFKLNKHSFSLRLSRFRRRHLKNKVVRFKKPFSIRKLHFPRCHPKAAKLKLRRPVGRKTRLHRRRPNNGEQRFGNKVAELVSVFRSTKRSKELENVLLDLNNVSEMGNGAGKEPFPSPITPAFVRAMKKEPEDDDDDDDDDVEDVCRSFESYLVEMIVEDGKLKDLVDVEELLHCCDTLKSPVFVDLVCRFYGDVCKDLFALDEEQDTPTSDS